ncbi:hypothetical protein GCM10011321_38610 [Youhaiella tibetensis]|uniref:Uncharacterized protein n=1 Tax=Paradevosia tibetensis TaxID=1447062 RepID=A0A5B9DTG7_9HYPH|nr:hypothetical protein [Youhaiella tibetensis]QEE22205.1 hypothetical protein FNA67_19455 [Youhaiella tibetensis]GGF44372.1 hypothetical protein GCM10011321_38610 [Youhaiella tibetensis]
MDMNIAVSAAMMSAAQTQNLIQVAVMRQQHQMETNLADMVAQAVQNAPAPAGQGVVVDKLA